MESEVQAKLGPAVMQALIKATTLEKALIKKKILTEAELAESLAEVVSDIWNIAKELGVTLGGDEEQEDKTENEDNA